MNVLEKAAEVTGIYNQGADEYKDALNELYVAQSRDTKLLAELKSALDSAAVAANDAAEAERKLAETREQMLDEASQRVIQDLKDEETLRVQMRQRAMTESDPAAVQRDIDNLRLQYQESIAYVGDLAEAYRNHAISFEDYRAATNAALRDQESWLDEIQSLEGLLPVAQMREAFGLFGGMMSEEQKAARGRLDIIEAFGEESAAIEAKRQLIQEREAIDFERKRTRDLAAHYQDLAQLDVDFYDKRTDLLEEIGEDLADVEHDRLEELKDYTKESLRQAEDHKDRLLKIERDTDEAFQDAARRRDTAGALAALRQGQRQIRDEGEQYAKEKERREEDYEDRLEELDAQREEKLKKGQEALADLREQHSKERRERIRAFQERLRQEYEERRIRLQRQQDDWRNEDYERRRHYLAQQGLTSDHYTKVQTISDTGMQNVRTVITNAWAALVGDLNKVAVGGGRANTVPRTPKGYAGGGDPPLDEWIKVGEHGEEWRGSRPRCASTRTAMAGRTAARRSTSTWTSWVT